MSNLGVPAPSLFGGNVVWAIAYHFGFPVMVVIGLGAVLWTIAHDIHLRIT
ncbi:MAG: hypothetical protein JO189_08990 [Deltaproteobacteria bacterium]|nr:hypothetical protein [Deltaproteobacteria bacterium]